LTQRELKSIDVARDEPAVHDGRQRNLQLRIRFAALHFPLQEFRQLAHAVHERIRQSERRRQPQLSRAGFRVRRDRDLERDDLPNHRIRIPSQRVADSQPGVGELFLKCGSVALFQELLQLVSQIGDLLPRQRLVVLNHLRANTAARDRYIIHAIKKPPPNLDLERGTLPTASRIDIAHVRGVLLLLPPQRRNDQEHGHEARGR
jgi:hypothetical protein